MAKRNVPNENGKFHIKGKDTRVLDLEFVDPADAQNHVIEELTGDELMAKLPSPPPTSSDGKSINWFVNFNVYEKGSNRPNAKVKAYTISLAFVSGTRYFVYYNQAVHEITDDLKKPNGKTTLTSGDPPTGSIP